MHVCTHRCFQDSFCPGFQYQWTELLSVSNRRQTSGKSPYSQSQIYIASTWLGQYSGNLRCQETCSVCLCSPWEQRHRRQGLLSLLKAGCVLGHRATWKAGLSRGHPQRTGLARLLEMLLSLYSTSTEATGSPGARTVANWYFHCRGPLRNESPYRRKELHVFKFKLTDLHSGVQCCAC